MTNNDHRQARRARQQRARLKEYAIWGGLALLVLLALGAMIWQGVRPATGESVSVMTSSPHITIDTDPGSYNSDPPTSGLHYPEEATAKFYDTNYYTYPAGYLVHNLEHGYVIFWYNCNALSESDCADLKTQIKSAMDDLGGIKLIAYPWPSLDVPVAMTSWGRLQKFETFDPLEAKAFVRSNLNRSPEPNAP